VGDSNDCDDGDAAINPGVDEDCVDGLDNDCDGLIDLQDDECDEPDDTEAPDDSDSPDDTGPADDDTASADDDEPDDGCACSSADPVGFGGLFGLLALSLVTARRRPGHRR
jgi:MYXO-CTERM domain-containing protein